MAPTQRVQCCHPFGLRNIVEKAGTKISRLETRPVSRCVLRSTSEEHYLAGGHQSSSDLRVRRVYDNTSPVSVGYCLGFLSFQTRRDSIKLIRTLYNWGNAWE